MRTMIAVLPVATMALAACTTGPELIDRRVTYNCERGAPVTVVYAGETARIENQGGEPIVLQRRVSGSGLWYESPTHTVRSRGDEIVYTVGRSTPMVCRSGNVRPEPR